MDDCISFDGSEKYEEEVTNCDNIQEDISPPNLVSRAEGMDEDKEGIKYLLVEEVQGKRFLDRIKNIANVAMRRVIYTDISPLINEGVPFLVDGDSLLLAALDNSTYDKNCGGQTLHLVYICECLLNRLVSKGGTFILVFLDVWTAAWKNPEILLARAILLYHFKYNTKYPAYCFRSYGTSKFADFLKVIKPGFLLMNLHLEKWRFDSKLKELTCYSELCFAQAHGLNTVSIMEIYIGDTIVTAHSLDVPYFFRSMHAFDKMVCSERALLSKLESNSEINVQLPLKCRGEDLREVITLNSALLYLHKCRNESRNDWVRCFLYYNAVMHVLPLSRRGVDKSVEKFDDFSVFVSEMLALMEAVLRKVDKREHLPTLPDLWHGNLFLKVVTYLDSNDSFFEDSICETYLRYLQEINRYLKVNLESFPVKRRTYEIRKSEIIEKKINLKIDPIVEQDRLLPCSNVFVNTICRDIIGNLSGHVIDNKDFVDDFVTTNQKYPEIYHWHSTRLLVDALEDQSKDEDKLIPAKIREKLKHKFARFQNMYGASLEGRNYTSKAIVVEKSGHKQKESKMTEKARLIIEKNNIQKALQLEKSEREKLNSFKENYRKNNNGWNLESSLTHLDTLIKVLSNEKVILEALMIKTKILYNLWEESCRNNQRNLTFVEKIFLTIRSILQNFFYASIFVKESTNEEKAGKKVKKKDKRNERCPEIAKEPLIRNENETEHLKLLSKYLCGLGFESIAEKWNLPKHKGISNITEVGKGCNRFQLEYLGHELDRKTGGVPDSRVDGFLPDPWQKELFDIVDRNESALVVAPTSSGKTYAMYYCMEKTLRESDDGIVVYVAPTKPLVNQVAATVYARFKRKTMPAGKSVHGTFTSDYRQNPFNCQILITVPEILELIMLSPKCQSWIRRLKYIILDEVHSLSNAERGVSWERCFLLSCCSFLALSATIESPNDFQIWLQKMQNLKFEAGILNGPPRVNLVIHKERHSDLIKYNVVGSEMERIHPYSYLDENVINSSGGVPESLILSADETVQLYDLMVNIDGESLKRFDPETYFNTETGFISRPEVRKMEKDLKKIVEEWAQHENMKFKALLNALSANLLIGDRLDNNELLDGMWPLIQLLKRKDMLPAVLFSYDRAFVNDCLVEITEYLEDESDVVRCRREDKKRKKEEKRMKALREKEQALSKDSAAPKGDPEPTLNLLQGENRNRSSLQGLGVADQEDIKFIEYRLIKKGLHKDDYLCRGIRQGVSMHHGGMNAVKRTTVEMLFRMRILNCIFATGTLALGIHTPCKTVVIAGDSLYINSLEFHQMSGRAGRRGYDNVGNVIFYGIANIKTRMLLTSPLPKLIGSFPLRVSTVLRIMLLLSEVNEPKVSNSKSKQLALERCKILLGSSMLYESEPSLKIQIEHFFYFSVQYLMLLGVLDTEGCPQNFTGIITRLHYHEPGNLAFVYLFLSGALRKICELQKNGKVSYESELKMITVLNFLFARKYVLKEVVKRKKLINSVVILPPLPEVIKRSLINYNEQTRLVYSFYMRSVADTFQSQDSALPLSGIKIEPRTEGLIQTNFTSEPPKVCSIFAALSGNSDSNVSSAGEYISNIRQDIYTPLDIIPYINLDVTINSYALDFYKHGIATSISRDNNLKQGEDFALLKDFNLVLKAIYSFLVTSEPNEEDDAVLKTFKTVHDNFDYNFKNAYCNGL